MLGIRDRQAPSGGLCEYVQLLSIFDYICVGAFLENGVLEYVDHLHEHFLDPVVIKNAHYMAPSMPGYSIKMRPESLDEFEFPSEGQPGPSKVASDTALHRFPLHLAVRHTEANTRHQRYAHEDDAEADEGPYSHGLA